MTRVALREGYPDGYRPRLVGRVLSLCHGDESRMRARAKAPTVHADLRPGPAIDVRLDARDPLPFSDDAFDTIVAQRTICSCKSTRRCCGGIALTAPASERFLREIARVLNKRNPLARAHLMGRFHRVGSERAMAIWRKAAERVMRSEEVEIDLFRHDPPARANAPDRFYGLTSVVVRAPARSR
jgi:SAM-dependent methyltransferase